MMCKKEPQTDEQIKALFNDMMQYIESFAESCKISKTGEHVLLPKSMQ